MENKETKDDDEIEFYSDDGDNETSSSDSLAPASFSKNFEFTNNRNVLRLVRMFLCLEIVGIVIDTPSFYVPTLFKICCRTILFYAIRFYSRPMLDVVYIIQLFFSSVANLFQVYVIDRSKAGVNVHLVRRYLYEKSYLNPTTKPVEYGAIIDFIEPHNWHTIAAFGQYFLGIYFAVLFVLFTFKMWQILDWTDRNEVREWLKRYIADGWWRRGGLMVAVNSAIGMLLMLFFMLFIFATARQVNVNSLPEPRIIGGILAVCLSTLFVIWGVGYMGIRSTEVAFIRYVSQNVSYTSSMVLKKAVKAKLEVGFSLMMIIFAPVLYNLTQALILVHDWNDNWSTTWRKPDNLYVPCYFFAFPPYYRQNEPNSCQFVDSLSPNSPQRTDRLFSMFTIIQCDSFFGIFLYTATVICWGMLVFGYGYLFSRLVFDCIHEIKSSKWVSPLHALKALRGVEVLAYQQKYTFRQRLYFGFTQELRWQYKELRNTLAAIFPFFSSIFMALTRLLTLPLKILIGPMNFVFERLFVLGCDGLTLEGRRRHFRQMQLQKLDRDRTYRNRRFTIGQVYDVKKEEEKIRIAEMNFKSYPDMVLDAISSVGDKFYSIFHTLGELRRQTQSKIWKSELVTSLRARSHFFVGSVKKKFFNHKQKLHAHHKHAPWRLQNHGHTKSRMIREIDSFIRHEVERIKHEFVTDHALGITVFDTTMDTAGMTYLICPYGWEKLWWTLVVMFEMGLYAVIGALGNYYCNWQVKTALLLVINIVFGVITYANMPYTAMLDRSLEFLGRMFVSGICVGILIVYVTLPQSLRRNPETIPLFKPWDTFKMIATQNPFQAGLFVLVDGVMVIYFFAYIVYIMQIVGLFRTLQRKINAVIYSMHDHILDLLMEKLDERTVGMENVCSGLKLVQQWDDLIDEQRRYALWTWPDVRPYWQLTAMQKMVEVKWAAAFNLSILNIRSSLGLTLLHTVLCGGDCESARWIVHRYPELLHVEDMQRDSPLAIALKECSFFVLKYSEQNKGAMADGSSFADDVFDDYYPEIEEFRDLNAELGEFFPDEAHEYPLRAIEIDQFISHGFFNEIQNTLADKKPSFYERKMKEKQAALEAAAAAAMEAGGSVNGVKSVVSIETVSVDVQKERLKISNLRKNAQMDRLRMAMARFPEDACENNLSSGQMDAWKMVGLEIPEANLYLDDEEMENPILAEDFGEDVARDKVVHIEPKSKRVLAVKDVAAVPMDHPDMEKIQDWHFMGEKREVKKRSSRAVASDSKKAFLDAGGAVDMFSMSKYDNNLDLQARLREVRWRLCKYTELFLSKEISENCREVGWDVHLYKEWNKLASSLQGRIAQNLCMVCNFDAPEGFSRISEWTLGVAESEFDEPDYSEDKITRAEKGVLTVVNAYNRLTSTVRGAYGAVKKQIKRLQPGHSSTVASEPSHGAFNDRIIHFLAECLVCSRQRLNLTDCELSVYGRFGWRAIIRTMRRKYCSFILPSTFVNARVVKLVHLELGKNELDCGDAVLLADALLYQQSVKFIDLSYNRIGARGMRRLCQVLKTHEGICTLRVDHNRIGPGAGAEIGSLLKQSKCLRVLVLSHNRMGPLHKYTQMFVRERMGSAAKEIITGLRLNKYLQLLDISYNHLGPDLAKPLPGALNRHPSLTSLNISGNEIGAEKGAALLYSLAGNPGGDKMMWERINFYATIKDRESKGEDVQTEIKSKLKEGSAQLQQMRLGIRKIPNRRRAIQIHKPTKQLMVLVNKTLDAAKAASKRRPCQVAELCIADNQLGMMSGHGLAALINRNRSLTAVDISRNSLGPVGGAALAAMLERIYGIPPRDFLTEAVQKAQAAEARRGRENKKPKPLYTNLTALDVSRNGLGPKVIGSLMLCLGHGNCTVTDLNISENPLGVCGSNLLKSESMAQDLRHGLSNCQTLTRLDMSRSLFVPTQLVTMLGGLANNRVLMDLSLRDVHLDEPSCLQLAHVLDQCVQINRLNLRNCSMGAQGSYLVLRRLATCSSQYTFMDLSQNSLGPRAAICVGKCIRDPNCSLVTLLLSDNNLTDDGGSAVANALLGNTSIRKLDLSSNNLSPSVGHTLTAVAKGAYKHGRLVSKCKIVEINLSSNPFGPQCGLELVRALISGDFKRVEIRRIGVGVQTAELIGRALRDVCTTWQYVDISENNFGRMGMNRMVWSLRVNRSIRVFKCESARAGPIFGTEEDALLKHGVCIPRMIRSNVVIRELDLSNNGLSSTMGTILFEAMLDNYSIRRLSVRGNLFDDDMASALGDCIRYNNVIEDLDLGENKLGYDCCFVIASGLEVNHAIKYLTVDNNRLGNAAIASIEALTKALLINHTLRHLVMDGNKIGPDAGAKFFDVIIRNNTLIKLSLRDNRLDAMSGSKLVMGFQHNPHLMELGLSADEVGIDCWTKFSLIFDKKRALATPDDLAYDTIVSDDVAHIVNDY